MQHSIRNNIFDDLDTAAERHAALEDFTCIEGVSLVIHIEGRRTTCEDDEDNMDTRAADVVPGIGAGSRPRTDNGQRGYILEKPACAANVVQMWWRGPELGAG